MFKDDDEEEENTFGTTRYACMPSLVALQQMRNRLHLAHLGRKLMKWTAMATGRELRKIAIELDAVIQGFSEEMRNAFILLARGRYFCPELNKIVLENIGTEASVTVIPTAKTVSAVKMVHYEISETGVPPYPHLGIEKGGQAIMEAKKAWLDLLKKLIMIMQLRTSFMMVEQANKNATKKWNVLSKMVAPRVMLSMRYIISELEEIEREDNFRLKRFKQLKIKKNKGDDDVKYPCYCDKKPGKGDDFKCEVCKQEEDKRSKSKKNMCVFKTPSCIVELIGDKASTFCTVNQKCLDALTSHLEKVISLTGHCKTEGLVSPSVDTFIYACKEVRCKLDEIDQIKSTSNETTQDASCSVCEDIKDAPTCDICEIKEDACKDIPCKDISCENNSEAKEQSAQETCYVCHNKDDEAEAEDSFGCFETKYKEIVKVKKFKNEDGTVSEEKQVITIKTERKCPQNTNTLSENACCKIKSIESFETKGSEIDSHHHEIDKSCNKEVQESKSENDKCCMRKAPEKIRSCFSDSGENRRKETVTPVKSKCCNINDTATDPKTPSVTSHILCCNEKCPSVTKSNQLSNEKITECRKMDSTEIDFTTPSVTSNICCAIKCPSATASMKSKVSAKASKSSNQTLKQDPAKKGESCSCKFNKRSGSNKTLTHKNTSECCKICDRITESKPPSSISYTGCSSKCPASTENTKSKISAKSSKSCLCKNNTNKPRDKKISEACDSEADSMKPSVPSCTCCPKKLQSATESIRSKASSKTSTSSKRDESCECKTEKQSVCCDAIWKDVASSTTELRKNSEENELLRICIQEPDETKLNKKGINPMVQEKSPTSSVHSCRQLIVLEKKQSHTCRVCSKSRDEKAKRDISTTTSNMDLKQTSIVKEKPILLKCHSCNITKDQEIKKTSSAPKTSCKIKIISKEKDDLENQGEKVQEIIFYGNILDAIKKILSASISDEQINESLEDTKTTDSAIKSCSCTSRANDSSSKRPSMKLSVKSSVCKTCEASQIPSDDEESSTYVSCKGIERSQSCPQCKVKNYEKSITWSSQRSKSDENARHRKPDKNITPKSICSACGSELSKATSAQKRFSRNTLETDKDSRVSSCTSLCNNFLDSAINLNNKDAKSGPCVCQSSKNFSFNGPSMSTISSTCKLCQTERSNCKTDTHENSKRFIKSPASCPRCEENKEQKKPERNSGCSVPQNAHSRFSKSPQSCPVCDKNQEQNKTERSLGCYENNSRRNSKPPKSCTVCERSQAQKKSEDHNCCSVPTEKSARSLCCGYTPRSDRIVDGSNIERTERCCGEADKTDASTSTKRTDRYDVRPLKMVKSQKKPTCTCHSDSYLMEKKPQAPKRSKSCSSYRGDYYS